MNIEPGHLYLIATPIGNLSDMSPRALSILGQTHLLACESRSAAQRLFSALKISLPKVCLYREDTSARADQEVVQALREQQICTLVSDAGTPTLSDPGWRLVARCHRENIPVVSVPGPSALTSALAASGLPSRRFTFEGFPPHGKGERREFFQRISTNSSTTVFFESPHKIHQTLQALSEQCEPTRLLAISREVSKIHEENRLRPLAEWLLQPPTEKGEFVVTIAGLTNIDPPTEELPLEQIRYLREAGLEPRALSQFLQRFHGVSRNQAYSLAHDPSNL